MKIHVLAASALLALTASFAQEFRGTFSGLVTDAQGTAVARAKIVAIEKATGSKSETLSSATGEYTIPFLAPGEYAISAEMPGFKTYKREGLTLSIGEHPVVDIQLEVGASSQSVTVTGEVPMIESANASVGQVISSEEVEDVPMNGRTPLMLSRISMGVTGTNEPGQVRPFDNAGGASFSVAGAPTQTNEVLINGVPDTTWDKRLAYSPPQDAVLEVSVHAFESDAAYGHTGGGVVNQITKGGTNGFHGSIYEFNQVSKLYANYFFNNATGTPRTNANFNQYGLSSGGPVIIPKVYNGKNKVFWFFALEKLKDSDPTNATVEGGSAFTTVPTAAERTGNFSALLGTAGTGASYQLYDPASGTLNGTTITRTPLVNNTIPTSRLNPIALNYLKLYPMPNIAGQANGENNYGIAVADFDGYDNELGRLDFNISDKNRLSYDFRHNYRLQHKNLYFSDPAFGTLLTRKNWGTSLDDIYTITPTLVLDMRASWTRFHEISGSPGDGVDPTTYGFPSYLAAGSQFVGLPYMQFASGCGANAVAFQCVGMTGDADTPYDIFQVFTSIVKIVGNHTIKAGVDLRDYRESTYPHGNSDGTFSFNSNWVTGPTSTAAAQPFGGDMAAFLLGLPSSGSYDLNTHSSSKSDYYSVYAQDDWRFRSNLTLNLGLRWEYESPTVERYNRVVDGFNATAVNPISAAAAAAYAQSPAALLPVNQFSALGGLTYAGAGNRNVYDTKSGIFSPRVGAAWTPSWLHQTVLRGGFGLFVAPNGINGAQTLNQEGFSQTTQFVATSNNYLSPATTLSNPFPSGFLQPSSNNGPGTAQGTGVTFFNPHVLNAYSVRWNAGIQRQIPGGMVLEVAYIGNHAVHLPITTQLDYIPRRYLSTSPYRDAAENATVSLLGSSAKGANGAAIVNPFQGLLPNSSYNGATVNLQQLLIPYPQYPVPSAPQSTSNGVVEQYTNAGESYYNSLNVRLQKRWTNGLLLIENFAYSALVERVSYLNDGDPAPEKRAGGDSRPLRETLAVSWELPFGRGKHFDIPNKVLNAIAGGWAMNGALIFQSGPPLNWGNVVYLGGPLDWNAHPQNPLTPGATLNTAQFFTAASLQPSDGIRTFDTYFNNLRRDATKNADLSLLKKLHLREKMYLQLRFESFNITNRVGFGAPVSLNPTSASFGEITTQASTPRRVQIGLRLVW
ncbi:MAG TPA: carboxypeptidase regulatory-like domain-containing protein [Candidatus Acidoferrales bacterium]|nr:carboxypeptidase regulatory-like domain-containing protein [Candidatus Acidoferrales bacterium]